MPDGGAGLRPPELLRADSSAAFDADPMSTRMIVITTGGTIATSTDPAASGGRRSADKNLPPVSTSMSSTFQEGQLAADPRRLGRLRIRRQERRGRREPSATECSR